MRRIVLDTNCLLMSIPKRSPFRIVWESFLSGDFILCISNEILEEYSEILSQKINASIANNVISTILNQPNIERITPHFRFGLIQSDTDDNKFVDCAIAANAEYLVSNDSHFNILAETPFPKVAVIKLASFSRILIQSKLKEYVPYWMDDPENPVLNEPEIKYGKKDF